MTPPAADKSAVAVSPSWTQNIELIGASNHSQPSDSSTAKGIDTEAHTKCGDTAVGV